MVIFEAFLMPYISRKVSGFGARLADPSIPMPSPKHPSHLCTDSCGWRTWGATVPGHPHFGECRGHSRAECLPAPPHTVPCPAGTHRYCLALSPRLGSSVSSVGLPPSCRHGETVPVPVGDSSSSGSPAQPRRAIPGLPLQLVVLPCPCWTCLKRAGRCRLWDNLASPQLRAPANWIMTLAAEDAGVGCLFNPSL